MTNKTYRVEICNEETESGEAVSWVLAARQPRAGEPRQMDYGAASGLSADDAEVTRAALAKHAQVRVIAE